MPNLIDLTGHRYGQIVVLRQVPREARHSSTRWECRCDCGRIEVFLAEQLPSSESRIRVAEKFGHRLYTACRECTTKPCAVCGCPVPVLRKSVETCDSAECVAVYRERSRSKRGRTKVAEKLTNIEVGQRYGQLVVVENLGFRLRGRRNVVFWRCRCDCGNAINLPPVYLAGKSGTSYRSCEVCRQKTCVLCGEKYPYSRRYDFCDSPACCAYMELRRLRRKRQKQWNLEKHDPVKVALRLKWRQEHPGHTWKWLQSLPEDRREQYMANQRETARRRMAAIAADPARYEAFRAQCRVHENSYRGRKAYQEMIREAEKLVEMVENA